MRLQSALCSGAVPFSPGTSVAIKVVSSNKLHFTSFLWGPWLTDIYYPQFKLTDSFPRPEITEHSYQVMGAGRGLQHSPPLTGPSVSTYICDGPWAEGGDAEHFSEMLTVQGAIKRAQCESIVRRP